MRSTPGSPRPRITQSRWGPSPAHRSPHVSSPRPAPRTNAPAPAGRDEPETCALHRVRSNSTPPGGGSWTTWMRARDPRLKRLALQRCAAVLGVQPRPKRIALTASMSCDSALRSRQWRRPKAPSQPLRETYIPKARLTRSKTRTQPRAGPFALDVRVNKAGSLPSTSSLGN